jgi:PAS domain S-box-containing protein
MHDATEPTAPSCADAAGNSRPHSFEALQSIRDSRERRLAEQALRESEERFRATFEQAAVGIAHVGLDGRWLRVNQRYGDILGYSQQELLGLTFQAITHPDDLAADLAQARQLMAGEIDTYTMEKRYIRKDGSQVWVNLTGSRVSDEKGKLLYCIAVVEDITARKEAEQQLRELAHKLERQSRLFEQIAAATPDFIYVLDLHGRFVYANRRLLEVWGRSFEDAVGKSLYELGYPEWHADMHMRELRQVIETRQPIKGEVFFTGGSGISGIYEYIFTPVIGPDGKVEVIAGTTRDVTERKRFAEQLRVAKDAAEAASRAKDHFLAVLSHELRTPLNPALMAATIVEKSPLLAPELLEDVSIIRRNVELEARLIDDLLDLTRISRGKLILNRRLVDGGEVLLHAVQTCQAEAAEKQVGMEVVRATQPVMVYADSARLQQVFWNLLKNAIKFTPAGGSIHVTGSARPDGGFRVMVRDTGAGIEPAHLDRIFEAFEQGSARVTRQHGGLGLGLAICRKLVALHDGEIRAASEGPYRGATFTVELPPPQHQHVAPAGGGERTPGAQVSQRCHILLVEDHVSTARMTVRLLRSWGHTVAHATSVREALRLAGSEHFDLIISDLGLPDGSGQELVRKLREQRPVRAIAISGYGMESDVQQSVEAGFIEHLTKPINATMLQEAIARAMKS